MERQPNTEYVASISYGKDSIAMLEAIKQLGYPLDRIVSVQVWATDTIPADLPEMYEWKAKADDVIKQKYGIQVERLCAMKNGEKLTYEKQFYTKRASGKEWRRKPSKSWGGGQFYGFPFNRSNWCTSELKTRVIRLSEHNRGLVQQQVKDGSVVGFSKATKWHKNCAIYRNSGRRAETN